MKTDKEILEKRSEKADHANHSLEGVEAVCFGEGLSGLWP